VFTVMLLACAGAAGMATISSSEKTITAVNLNSLAFTVSLLTATSARCLECGGTGCLMRLERLVCASDLAQRGRA
jgi:hypothetical protein